MTKLIKILKYTLSVVMASLFMMSFSASSSHIKCIDYESGYLILDTVFIGEADCELGLTGNDTGQGDVNEQHEVDGHGMFDIDSWTLIEEHVDIDSGVLPNSFTVAQSYLNTYNTFMLTFKASNENSGVMPSVYIGYLLEPSSSTDSYNWFDLAMFKKEDGGFHEISHINLYGFDDDGVVIITCTTSTPCTDIPEPNLLFIFGLGLIGLCIRNRIFKLSRVV